MDNSLSPISETEDNFSPIVSEEENLDDCDENVLSGRKTPIGGDDHLPSPKSMNSGTNAAEEVSMHSEEGSEPQGTNDENSQTNDQENNERDDESNAELQDTNSKSQDYEGSNMSDNAMDNAGNQSEAEESKAEELSENKEDEEGESKTAEKNENKDEDNQSHKEDDNEDEEEEENQENDNESSKEPVNPLDGEANHSIERCDVNEKDNLETDVDMEDANKSTDQGRDPTEPTEEHNPEHEKNVENDQTMSSLIEADVSISIETNEGYQGDAIEIRDDENQTEENFAEENEEPEEEDVCLLPDTEKELTGAEKEQAILARENAEKRAKEAELETQLGTSTTEEDREQTTPEEGPVEDDPIVHCIEDETEEPNNDNNDALSKDSIDELEIKEIISSELPNEQCIQCEDSSSSKPCQYRVREEDKIKYLCSIKCVGSLRTSSDKEFKLTARKVNIVSILNTQNTCIQCNTEQLCTYRFRDVESMSSNAEDDNEESQNAVKYHYLCNSSCMDAFVGKNLEKFVLKTKRYIVEEMLQESTSMCIHCKEEKSCKYSFSQDENMLYICNDDCFNLVSKEEPERYRLKRRLIRVRKLGMNELSSPQTDPEKKIVARTQEEAESYRIEREESFIRRCTECLSVVEINEKSLIWETFDFCSELCLGKYQKTIGSECMVCNSAVPLPSLGKYCVRFGFDMKQFCRTACLDKFKKSLKNCTSCQKDISQIKEAFLAPVGNRGQFKDFCSQACMSLYDSKCAPRNDLTAGCAVCSNEKTISAEIILDGKSHYLCSTPCFSAFKFVNNVFPDQCGNCSRYFERKLSENHTIYNENGEPTVFCCKICMNIYITANRKIVSCQWCKVKKYNFDMIQKRYRNSEQKVMLCSINCLTLHGVSISAISLKRQKCDECGQQKQAQYHLTMSDASVRNFCSYQCVMLFQGQFDRPPFTIDTDVNYNLPETNNRTERLPFPTGEPKRISTKSSKILSSGTLTINNTSAPSSIPVISSVTSLANTVNETNKRKGRSQANQKVRFADMGPLEDDMPLLTLLSTGKNTRRKGGKAQDNSSVRPVQKKTIGINTTETFKGSKTRVLTLPPIPTPVFNKQTLCKPAVSSKATLCRPITNSVECQTTEEIAMKIPIPIPVPIYVPQPMYMYSLPFPCPVPIPLPIPVPIFIPTTRKSADGIMKEIKKIQEKMPTDPYEAELLMMAEMVAGEKKEESESESEPETSNGNSYQQQHHTPDHNNSFGEDVLQMALKMATECDEPAVDLESAMTTSTIDQSSSAGHIPMDNHHIGGITPDDNVMMMDVVRPRSGRGKKRNSTAINIPNVPAANSNRAAIQAAVASIIQPTTPPNKRARKAEQLLPTPAVMPQQQISPQKEITEKPDANMFLKYTFGVNAWKQWVMSKNVEMERSSIRRRPFKTELLQLTADELNYSLCLFVKEVRKPNGSEYAPDTIYYLVLGIQQYLYENGRIDNIFTDTYYERFTDCLDEVARKFSILYNDSQFIVTRVEEEHLWECKQLGAHSPHVLLSTLMFFNTKYFNLTTVEEHMQLSFSHIMKHWKRNPPGSRGAGNRNVLLRFYPPQTGVGQNPKKKKVYEQVENEEDPLRCPVKLYEFYLSKCPESVKTRNDVFYLQPERSCVPDSPVWYSTQALSEESLCKMLHRVKMVKEINIAILTS